MLILAVSCILLCTVIRRLILGSQTFSTCIAVTQHFVATINTVLY